jgi:hypothetical protein
MSGILGGGSASTDRGNQLAAVQGNWNLFGYGLPLGQSQEATGQANLGSATDYFKSLLNPGRQQVAQRSAPGINAADAATTEQRNAEGAFGTQRVGGTVAANREASTTNQSNIDNIINTNLVQGQAEGAKGLTQIGGIDLSNAMAALGLSQDSINEILTSSLQSRGVDFQQQQATGAGIGQLIMAGLTLAG